MTRALSVLNDADDIGPEQQKAHEPAHVNPTDPVIAVPATVPSNRIEIAIEASRKANAERANRVAEGRERLEEALYDSEPSRDELDAQADALLATANNDPATKGLARAVHDAMAERQELVRNVKRTLGATIPELETIGENVEEQLRSVIGMNAAYAEAIRHICASAGTVRIDELVPVTTLGGGLTLVRRFADIGDEEPGQDHFVDPRFLLPAALRVAARFSRLMQEHQEATKRASDHAQQIDTLRRTTETDSQALTAAKARLRTLEANAQAIKPDAPGTPEGYYLKAGNGRWIAEYDGKHTCFLTRWRSVTNLADAHSFAFKEEAEEALLRLQMAKLHRVGRVTRDTLRVVTVRFEDHSE